MHRYRLLALAFAGILFYTGICQATIVSTSGSLVLTKNSAYQDAFGSPIIYSYTASTQKFTFLTSTFAQYTPDGIHIYTPSGATTYALTAYISNTGVPLNASQLSTLGVSDSIKVSGTINGVPMDLFDSTTLLDFSSSFADSTSPNITIGTFDFEFSQDANGVLTWPWGNLFGMILSGRESTYSASGGFASNFSSSASLTTADVIMVPEPTTAVLLLGVCGGALMRRPSQLKRKQ
jgi:hypothetical protein